MKPTLTIMCGLPRSGKSTWLKKNKGDAIIISPDEIRKEVFGHQFHGLANKFVFGMAEGMASLILKQGKDVIIDATNTTVMARESWGRLAKSCGAKPRIILVSAGKTMSKNLLAVLERNELSPEGSKLPIEAIERMALQFEHPKFCKGDTDFEIIEYNSIHRRKIPKSKRINVGLQEGVESVIDKWRSKWVVAENKGKGS